MQQVVLHLDRGVPLLAELTPDPIDPDADAEEDAAGSDERGNHEARVSVAERALLQVHVVRDHSCRYQDHERRERQGGASRVDERLTHVQKGVAEDEAKHVRKDAQPGDAAEEVDHGRMEHDLSGQHAVVSHLDGFRVGKHEYQAPVKEEKQDLDHQDDQEGYGHRDVGDPEHEPQSNKQAPDSEPRQRLRRLLFALRP